jgi:hypothetical protein
LHDNDFSIPYGESRVKGFHVYKGGDPFQNLEQVKKTISSVMLDKASITIRAKIEPTHSPLYNNWRANAQYQKLYFHLDKSREKPTTKEWPPGLDLFVRGYFITKDTQEDHYSNLVQKGGRYKITGVWTKGYFHIKSLQAQ